MPNIPKVGGAIVQAPAFNSTAIDVSKARGFYIYSSQPAWISFQETSAQVTSMDTNTKATPIAGGQLYGPLDVLSGFHKYLHVAGHGVAADIVVTLL